MSVMNRAMFRNAVRMQAGGDPRQPPAWLRMPPGQMMATGIAGLRESVSQDLGLGDSQSAPSSVGVGPMRPEAFDFSGQALEDPRAVAAQSSYDALQSLSDEQLVQERQRGRFDPALVEAELERRGFRSPAARAGIGALETAAKAGEPWTVGAQVDRYRKYIGQPFARGVEWAFTPGFPGGEEQDADAPVNPAVVANAARVVPENMPDVEVLPPPSEGGERIAGPAGAQASSEAAAGPQAAVLPGTPADNLLAAYEQRADLYNSVLGDTDERKKAARSRIMLDIAARGLRIAGGVDEKGQRMQGSPMAQAAQALAGAPGVIAEEGQTIRDQDIKLRLARLQQAEQDVRGQTEREFDFASRSALQQAKFMMEQYAAGTVKPLAGTAGDEPEELSRWREEFNPRLAFGTGAKMRNWANATAAVPGIGMPAAQTDQAIADVSAFNNALMGRLANDIQEGRVAVQTMEWVRDLIPNPTEFTTSPERAVSRYQSIRDRFQSMRAKLESEFNSADADRREEIRQEHSSISHIAGEVDSMLQAFGTPGGNGGGRDNRYAPEQQAALSAAITGAR